jgi:Na+/H+ antiporter NhaC
MVVLPEFIANIIAHIVFVLTLLCLFFLCWKKRFAFSNFFLTVGAQILVLIFSGGLTWAILEGMYFLHYRYGFFSEVLISENHYGMHSDILLMIFFLLYTVCAALLFGFIWRRKNQQVSDENYYAHIMGVLLLPRLNR